MLDPPSISPKTAQDVNAFLGALKAHGFCGETDSDDVTLTLYSTDNSIYQIVPQAVLFPRDRNDLQKIMSLAQEKAFSALKFMPRGGGTGTNGQSLNDCIVIDTSRHMTRILEIDYKNGWVKVEPGVVLDVLNAELKQNGYFFPPEISPGKSATLGGMVSTDACGKGSRVYGKTGDYILSMTCILADGSEIKTEEYESADLKTLFESEYADACAHLPDLPRGVSGYNIQKAYDTKSGRVNLNSLIAGSEGSLVVIKNITLRIVPKPLFKIGFALAYDDFDKALRHVHSLLKYNPVAIETIDDRILDLARGDIVWGDVSNLFPDAHDIEKVKALHFVEYEGSDAEAINSIAQEFESFLRQENATLLSYTRTDHPKDLMAMSALRRKCVGLLGNMEGNRRPIPFMEDTAVPPKNLPDYIKDVRAFLNSHNIDCGMFGHSDAGCLHIRPALDMRVSIDEGLIGTLTDGVIVLLKKHGGVLWGEHGKGMRSAYTAQLLGTAYYALMQKIKAHFDPYDRLNPGKIATSGALPLYEIDELPMRGHYDRQIKAELAIGYEKATQCNGNGMCFSAMPDDTMCPSYRVTRDRKHSPKGRAGLLREWLRLKSVNASAAEKFAPSVYESLQGCLSCKACTATCPIHVNIPDMKSRFLQEYHANKCRPLRDYAIALNERILPFGRYLPMRLSILLGLRDAPIARGASLAARAKAKGFRLANAETISKAKSPLLIIQDAYTSYIETDTGMAVLEVFRKLGYEPLLVPFFESGKGWHVRGFLKTFERIARRNLTLLRVLEAHKVPMIGIEPSLTLLYRDEYKAFADGRELPKIQLLQEFLADADWNAVVKSDADSANLFLHCAEKTMHPKSGEEWRSIFAHLGVKLDIVETGCCGMAGSYGHEVEHYENSKALFELSWKKKLQGSALITGFSCRSQAKRFGVSSGRHPAMLLNELL